MNQGKLVILFIFGLSAVMGGYAWWHHYTQGRKCVELWGAEAGNLIRYGQRVEVMRLNGSETSEDAPLELLNGTLPVVARKEITATPGLVHARQALIEDASFLWDHDVSGPAHWDYALRFTDGEQQVSVAIDCQQGRVKLVGTDRQAMLKPHLTKAYQDRLPMWLGMEANVSPAAESTTADMP